MSVTREIATTRARRPTRLKRQQGDKEGKETESKSSKRNCTVGVTKNMGQTRKQEQQEQRRR